MNLPAFFPRLLLFLCLLLPVIVQAQNFTQADTLRGALRPERTWWDLNYYHLKVSVDPEARTIKGSNEVRFTALNKGQVVQIDLQAPMLLHKARWNEQDLSVAQNGNAYFIDLGQEVAAGTAVVLDLTFGGTPIVARMPPWDGGLTWDEDENGLPFVANANQGIGASVWWPCKDHPADEVDSMRISVTVPDKLYDVSNGQLEGIEKHNDGSNTFHWLVRNPINNYGVNISIGDYVRWLETYEGESGPLQLSYYVLRDNETKARKQFQQVPMMMRAFEHWFGPYPFYADGFKLVEVPYLGMEHQSAVTYGNEFGNGYRGRDLSGTGEGLKFDFIIIHEAGHEWFANNITNADVADMWIHEGFTAYSENLYLDYHFGKAAASTYVIGTRNNIRNDRPIQSPYRGVAHAGSGDMYYKGANMLHTLRQVVGNDEQWRQILRGLNEEFRHQTVTATELVDYMATEIQVGGFDVERFFAQYTQTTQIPVLEYVIEGKLLYYRWNKAVSGFAMPVKVLLNDQPALIAATTSWNKHDLSTSKLAEVKVVVDYYVLSKQLDSRE